VIIRERTRYQKRGCPPFSSIKNKRLGIANGNKEKILIAAKFFCFEEKMPTEEF
jgi:hypothetical protein